MTKLRDSVSNFALDFGLPAVKISEQISTKLDSLLVKLISWKLINVQAACFKFDTPSYPY